MFGYGAQNGEARGREASGGAYGRKHSQQRLRWHRSLVGTASQADSYDGWAGTRGSPCCHIVAIHFSELPSRSGQPVCSVWPLSIIGLPPSTAGGYKRLERTRAQTRSTDTLSELLNDTTAAPRGAW